MNLKVTAHDARNTLLAIPHKTCTRGIEEHWKVKDGNIAAQSVFWLFCWAKTGQGSEEARLASVRAFDNILPVPFSDMDPYVDHEYARKARYSHRDIENEFKDLMKQIGH